MTCPSAAATSISPASPKSTCTPRVPVKHGTCAAPSAPPRSRLHARTTCAARPAQRTSHTRSAPSLSPHANTCSRSAPACRLATARRGRSGRRTLHKSPVHARGVVPEAQYGLCTRRARVAELELQLAVRDLCSGVSLCRHPRTEHRPRAANTPAARHARCTRRSTSSASARPTRHQPPPAACEQRTHALRGEVEHVRRAVRAARDERAAARGREQRVHGGRVVHREPRGARPAQHRVVVRAARERAAGERAHCARGRVQR
jgi:hypothetical protein